MYIYSLHPGHIEAKRNDRKVKRSKFKKKEVGWKRENPKLVQRSSACEEHRKTITGMQF